MGKIYCNNCAWLGYRLCIDNSYSCRNPSNIIEKDTWLKKVRDYDKSPEQLNRNNNCPFFMDAKVQNGNH